MSNTPVTFAHEGLQVASNTPVIFAHEQQQKQVIEYYGEAPDGKEAVHSAVEEGIYFNDDNGKVNKGKKRICGLSAVTFWLVVVIAVLVITGAVGGGIGGSLAAKNSKKYLIFSSLLCRSLIMLEVLEVLGIQLCPYYRRRLVKNQSHQRQLQVKPTHLQPAQAHLPLPPQPLQKPLMMQAVPNQMGQRSLLAAVHSSPYATRISLGLVAGPLI